MPIFQLTALDYIITITISVVLIIGGYQFYFLCQRHSLVKPRLLSTFVDSWFGYKPSWIWVYTILYYPTIILVVFTLEDMRHFNYTVFSYLILLLIHMPFFIFFTVKLPKEWREQVKGETLSERFLKFVHKYDAPNNCFPSMHVSVATLTSLHIMTNLPQIGLWVIIFPIVISLSSLYTKQHYFLDLPVGAFLGWSVFKIFLGLY